MKHNKQNKLQIKQNKVHVTQHSTGIRSHQREHLRDETVSRNIISIFTLLWYYVWSLNPETCSYCTSVIHYRHKTNHFSCWKFLSSHQLKENHCFELVWSKTILCVCFFFCFCFCKCIITVIIALDMANLTDKQMWNKFRVKRRKPQQPTYCSNLKHFHLPDFNRTKFPLQIIHTAVNCS